LDHRPRSSRRGHCPERGGLSKLELTTQPAKHSPVSQMCFEV
jgi:hypothetical protein